MLSDLSGWLAASNEPADFGKLTILRFPSSGDQALDSLDTFTSNVARDPDLSQEITTRRDAVLRGNTIVVPPPPGAGGDSAAPASASSNACSKVGAAKTRPSPKLTMTCQSVGSESPCESRYSGWT